MKRKTLINIILVILLIVFLFNAGEIGRWIFIAIIGLLGIRIVAYVASLYKGYLRNRQSNQREFLLKVTASLMGFFFITGTIAFIIILPYMDGADQHHDFNNVELILRSMVCSLDMFMLDVDSNILDNLSSWPVLKGLILIQATCSFMCTIFLLVSLIFTRIKAYYILHRKTRITQEKNHLYLFFGMGENSMLLAKSVAAHDPRALSIFIDEANIKDDESDGWNNIVSLFTHRHKTFEIAESAHALVAIASKNISDLPESNLEGEDVDIFSILGLSKVKQLIESLPKYTITVNPEEKNKEDKKEKEGEKDTPPQDPAKMAQLHIFFMSEDEDLNIRSLINLAKDRLIIETGGNKSVVERIYCHARYNGPNRIIEDLAVRKKLNVEIIDSSHLAVELLKANGEDQPVTVATLSKEYPTAVASPLECLIVGFGEVGRDAFRYLYEYATFVEVEDGKASVCKPTITAIDKRMDLLSGLFRANTPAVDYNTDIRNFRKFNLLNLDYGEYEFYNTILSEERCKKLNYILLALGDEDRNIALAANIFNRIRRYRSDLSQLIIMVRCLNDEKVDMMQKVAAHFNRGCGYDYHDVIRLFGRPEDIYSYSTIIREDLTERGKKFFNNYVRLRNDNDTWDGRHEKLTMVEISETGEVGYPDIDKLRKLRRQENQDLSNALHAATKVELLKKALEADEFEGLAKRLFAADGSSTKSGERDSIYYPMLTEGENEIMLRLAQLEHVRWNAAHEMLGYENNLTDDHRCIERTQQHNCLKDWEELDEESRAASSASYVEDYKSYDFSVVETSISINS